MFIENKSALVASVQAFMDAPEYWRDAISSKPKYFVCAFDKDKALFGLSKFCAFDSITLQEYVVKYRHHANGTQTQKKIAKVTGQHWIPLSEVSRNIKDSFEKWFSSIVGNRIGRENLHIMVIDDTPSNRAKSKRSISPEELEKQLHRQNEVGKIGEKIAVQYEIERLRNLGVKSPETKVSHVAIVNVAAGFDIRSECPEGTRYIEVKSSTAFTGAFYVSPNEIDTLRMHADSGYIYMVEVTDLDSGEGVVKQEIANPFPEGERCQLLTPVLYKANF
jgi:hypothetical protein